MTDYLLRILPALMSLFLLIPAPLSTQMKDKLPPAQCQTDDDRIRVLLLASYHMANPGLDKFNLKVDDVLAPERQSEIQELVTQLALFQPTKIAIEAPFNDSTTVANYHEYMKEAYELSRYEREQIGFRLARILGHADVYPIDVRMALDNSALSPIIADSPSYQAQMAELQRFGEGVMTQMEKWLADGTVSEMLYQMNRPEVLAQAHWPYIRFLTPIAEEDNYAGANIVGDWYTRNLRIFANLNRISDPGDRILVIYGQGHIPTLRQFVKDSPLFCLVDPLTYLRKDH